jgi:hypothetical protein
VALQIYPYVPLDNGAWSIPDSAMAAVWEQLEAEGKAEQLFYDGTVRDVPGWLEFIKRPQVFLLVVADPEAKRPVHVAWLKDVYDGVAWAHHCSLGRYHRGTWGAVLDYWRGFQPLRLLLGLTPASNERAVKFLKKICGFTVVGTIPEICNLAYEGRRVDGIVSYYQLRKEDESWAEAKAVRAALPISM